MRLIAVCAVAAALHGLAVPGAAAQDDAAARAERWADLRSAAFGDRPIGDAGGTVALDAPLRAEDAAIVPLTLKTAGSEPIAALTLVIDENPSPVAARIEFGPAGDASRTGLRVRVNSYTTMHLVAETARGELLQTAAFVKASGGCSAPIGVTDEEAMQGMGEMRLKFASAPAAGGVAAARLMIRHPNFTGMQMDTVTRAYTPARYLKDVTVTRGGERVFSLTGDISLSADPVIDFSYRPKADAPLKVTATDSDGATWEKTFPAEGAIN